MKYRFLLSSEIRSHTLKSPAISSQICGGKPVWMSAMRKYVFSEDDFARAVTDFFCNGRPWD